MSLFKFKANFFSEKYCLQVSTVACVLIALYSVVAGLFSHSTALILDGTLSVIDVITCFGTLYVLKLINSPASDKFPFGYYKLEPLIIAVQAAMLVIICFMSALHCIKDLMHHTSFIVNYTWGLSYSVACSVFVLIMCFYIMAVIKRNTSNLLRLELIEWRYGLWITLGLLIGFTLSYALIHSDKLAVRNLAQYVDSLMTLFIVIFIVRSPAMLCIQSCRELLDMKSLLDLPDADVLTMVRACAEKMGIIIAAESFKLRKSGRIYFGSLRYEVAGRTTVEQVMQLNAALKILFEKKSANILIDFIPTLK